jgi:sugar transferase (PEP-CTERM/EpsH1 system associated)
MPHPVLYLTHRVPYPPDKGDRIRNFHLLRQLAKRGRVWLGCLADEAVTADALAALHELCEKLAIVPTDRFARCARAGSSLLSGRSLSEGMFSAAKLRRTIREWTSLTRFQAAVVSASSLAPYLREEALRRTPAIVDLVDVDSQKWLDFASASAWPKNWLYRVEAARIRKLEMELPNWASAVSVVSRAEADLCDSFAGAGAATVASNGVDLDYFQPSDRKLDLACVFVGAMDYLPNIDGALWFAREVWPSLRSKYPGAEFRIVGRNPAKAVEELRKVPGVTVTGSVQDVRPFVSSASVVVVPLRLARGIQNKVLEAMAMGKAVVAASGALAALKTEPGKHLLAASTAKEWIDAVNGLFSHPVRCRDLGVAARQFVEQHHHWEHCLEPLLEKIYARTQTTREALTP